MSENNFQGRQPSWGQYAWATAFFLFDSIEWVSTSWYKVYLFADNTLNLLLARGKELLGWGDANYQ